MIKKQYNNSLEYLTDRGLTLQDMELFESVVVAGGKVLTKNYTWATDNKAVYDSKVKKYLARGTSDFIINPIFAIDGKFAGVSCRTMDETKHDSLFVEKKEKTKLFFNMNNALPHVIADSCLYITEGCFDTIAMVKAGIPNTVALLGTNIDYNHIFMAKATCSKVVFCLDGDSAGIEAVSKCVNQYKLKNVFEYFGLEDPDECIAKYGTTEFLNRIRPVL